jgi:hypothetical protein
VPADVWRDASKDERDAVRALAAHLRHRLGQSRFDPFELVDGMRDCIFRSNPWMQRQLRGVGARKQGWKAARDAQRALVRLGA